MKFCLSLRPHPHRVWLFLLASAQAIRAVVATQQQEILMKHVNFPALLAALCCLSAVAMSQPVLAQSASPQSRAPGSLTSASRTPFHPALKTNGVSFLQLFESYLIVQLFSKQQQQQQLQKAPATSYPQKSTPSDYMGQYNMDLSEMKASVYSHSGLTLWPDSANIGFMGSGVYGSGNDIGGYAAVNRAKPRAQASVPFGYGGYQKLDVAAPDLLSYVLTGATVSPYVTRTFNSDRTTTLYFYADAAYSQYLGYLTVDIPFWSGAPGTYPLMVCGVSDRFVNGVEVQESIGLRIDNPNVTSIGVSVYMQDALGDVYSDTVNTASGASAFLFQGANGSQKQAMIGSTAADGTQVMAVAQGNLALKVTLAPDQSGELDFYVNQSRRLTIAFNPDATGAYQYPNHSPVPFGSLSGLLSTLTSTTLTGLTISPSSVTAGSQFQVTATLSQPAPAGGVSVALLLNGQEVPPISVPVGQTVGAVTYTASPVNSATQYTFTANFGLDMLAQTVTVNPVSAPTSTTHLLWNNTDARMMFWNVDGGGNVTNVVGYGPYNDDGKGIWHANALATGADGNSRVVWNDDDSRVMLWNLNPQGGVLGITGYGPYNDDGKGLWHATAVSVGPQNQTHLLWNDDDGRVMLWCLDEQGNLLGYAGYGPYTDGAPQNTWRAVSVSTGPDGTPHVLWDNADHRAALWNVASDFSFTVAGYGPYTDDSQPNPAGNLWDGTAVSVGPDGLQHVLWSNTDRRAMLWSVDGGFNPTVLGGYGPYTDDSQPNPANNLWYARGLATGPDDVSHLLWSNTDRRAMLWNVDGAGDPKAVFGYGPYIDDSQPNPAQNLWSAIGVSAGP